MPALPWTRISDPQSDRDYVVMASRLPLTGYRYLPAFLRATLAIRGQLATSPGLIGYALDAHPLAKTFWTLSVWDSRDAIEDFSRARPHGELIGGIRPHMRPSTFVFWTVRGADLPVSWTRLAGGWARRSPELP